MSVHGWLRVHADTFHDFHCSWITHLKEKLNSGLLPEEYYAQSEQRAGTISPDVLTLQASTRGSGTPPPETPGLVAITERPPRLRMHLETSADLAHFASRRRTVVIRHVSGDRVVAMIEIASPANRFGRPFHDLVDKAVSALLQGVHVLLVDLFPATARHPRGLHGAIWETIADEEVETDPKLPLTIASYRAGSVISAEVEPMAIGQLLPDVPLFLTPEHYVLVPLNETYEQAWAGVPRRWQGELTDGAD